MISLGIGLGVTRIGGSPIVWVYATDDDGNYLTDDNDNYLLIPES